LCCARASWQRASRGKWAGGKIRGAQLRIPPYVFHLINNARDAMSAALIELLRRDGIKKKLSKPYHINMDMLLHTSVALLIYDVG
jgi:hypothetical protein